MTFSIVARCPTTGRLGVAVVTAVPAVGSMCPFTRAGVGAVSTQSWVNPYLALSVLDVIAGGQSARRALKAVLWDDESRDLRQIGVVDATGEAAAFTGASCTPWCGQEVGESFAVQGNMLKGREVILAMATAFRSSADTPLDEQLMRAMEAGDAAGSDKRGRQSASLRLQGAEDYPDLDLRIDEHPQPVAEMRRVLEIARIQLIPFVEGVPKRGALAGQAPDSVTALLALPPPSRPGGGGSGPG